MYRIIGVTPEGELALIKETFVKEGDETLLQWNDKDTTADCGSDGSLCTWANSKLYNRLNGLCKEGNTNCAGTISGTYGDSNIFIGNSYYEYLTNGSVWLDKISNHRWKYGESKKLDSYNGDNAYSIESQFSNSIDEAKIGLMYVHDFYYAYPGGNPENENTAKNAWIHFQKDGYNNGIGGDWLITKFGLSYLVYAWSIWSNGYLSSDDPMSNPREVRPVFYLTPDIIIKEGTTGEKDNPYIIDIEREYEYTGTPQEFVAPKDGYYQIELWGASGGSYDVGKGGNGAYTKGTIKLNKGEILYIYVGEYPEYGSGNCYLSNPNTSFNGSTVGACSGGGGATDIRLINGDWYNFDGLKSRIMVAMVVH